MMEKHPAAVVQAIPSAMKTMTLSSLVAVSLALVGCDARVNTAPPVVEKVEKKETTIVNPPAEKKVENNTTIVNPPAEKK